MATLADLQTELALIESQIATVRAAMVAEATEGYGTPDGRTWRGTPWNDQLEALQVQREYLEKRVARASSTRGPRAVKLSRTGTTAT